MTRSYGYRHRLHDIRDRLGHALEVYKFTPEQAIGYTIVECALLNGDAISEALSFSALATVAFAEFNYIDLGKPDSLSAYLGQHCNESQVAMAAAALQDEADRQAFMNDVAKTRDHIASPRT